MVRISRAGPRASDRGLCAASALAALLSAFAAPRARGEEIRIALSSPGASAAFELRGGGVVCGGPKAGPDAPPAPLSGVRHQVAARGDALWLDGQRVCSPLHTAGGEGLTLAGHPLSGSLWLQAQGGQVQVVNQLDLEDYVAAVVASEVPASWPLEALKAQAVAARTYAVAQKIAVGPGAKAHLGSSVRSQVYRGAARPAAPARSAAQATRGEVLTYDAAPIAAYFSASCGGVSESGAAAFGLPAASFPYLPSAPDGESDAGAPRERWTFKLPLQELTARLRARRRVLSPVRGLEVIARTGSGRVLRVAIVTPAGRVPMAGAELREVLGYQVLPSLWFDVQARGGVLAFRGRGNGHGVGLCQWGARGRAARGQGYREILAHYYPGAEIRRMY